MKNAWRAQLPLHLNATSRDGFGGAQCVHEHGSIQVQQTKEESQKMKNAWRAQLPLHLNATSRDGFGGTHKSRDPCKVLPLAAAFFWAFITALRSAVGDFFFTSDASNARDNAAAARTAMLTSRVTLVQSQPWLRLSLGPSSQPYALLLATSSSLRMPEMYEITQQQPGQLCSQVG
eukprot:gene1618-33008_t